jgi:Tfp pilus assembly protein PilF
LKRAEETYERALALSPGNTEALAGLGDVARRRNDTAAAARYYDRVLADNPSYLPALMAKADQQWTSGNRSAALALYHKVVDQTGGSTEYGRRAAQRIAEARASKEEQPEPEAPAAPVEAQAPKPSDIPPEIDTTDLPGLK